MKTVCGGRRPLDPHVRGNDSDRGHLVTAADGSRSIELPRTGYYAKGLLRGKPHADWWVSARDSE